MLNHIWLWMIVISILIAASIDIRNEMVSDKEEPKIEETRNLNEDTNEITMD